MPALIERRVAPSELGSSVSSNQVLRTVGSSFGTAVPATIFATHLEPDLRRSGAGITAAFGLGAVLCAAVFHMLLVHRFMHRPGARKAATPNRHPGTN